MFDSVGLDVAVENVSMAKKKRQGERRTENFGVLGFRRTWFFKCLIQKGLVLVYGR